MVVDPVALSLSGFGVNVAHGDCGCGVVFALCVGAVVDFVTFSAPLCGVKVAQGDCMVVLTLVGAFVTFSALLRGVKVAQGDCMVVWTLVGAGCENVTQGEGGV